MDNCAQISEKIRVAMALKSEIDEKKKTLEKLNKELADLAQYKDGSKTGHIYTEHYHVKVALKKNVKWDQKKLGEARAALGDEKFFGVFSWEFKPRGKAVLDAFFASADTSRTAPVLAAMTVSDSSPSVTYEIIEG